MKKPTYEELEQRIKELQEVVPESKQSGVLSLSRKNYEVADEIDILKCLDVVSQAMNTFKDVNDIIDDVIGAVFLIFGCDRIWLFYPCDPDAQTFQVLVEKNNPEYPGFYYRSRIADYSGGFRNHKKSSQIRLSCRVRS